MTEVTLCDFCLVSLSRDTCRWNSPLCYEQARVTQRGHMWVFCPAVSTRSSANSRDQQGDLWMKMFSGDFGPWTLWSKDESLPHTETLRNKKRYKKGSLLLRSSLFGEPEMEKHLTYPWEMCSDFGKHCRPPFKEQGQERRHTSWLLIS